MDWHRNGLVRPASVTEATRAYFDEQDVFGQWLDEECDLEPGNDNKMEKGAALYDAWKAYAPAGEPTISFGSSTTACASAGWNTSRSRPSEPRGSAASG